MNKRTKSIIILAIISFILVYLTFSFIILNFNPLYWTQQERTAAVLTNICFSVIIILAAELLKSFE